MMKNSGLLLLILFFNLGSFSLKAQEMEWKDDVSQDVINYFNAVQERNADEMLEYMHTGLFEMMPAENIKAMMEEVLEEDDVKVSARNIEVLEVQDLILIEKDTSRHTLVDYSYDMVITILDPESEEANSYTIDLLNAKYGEENVRIDKVTGDIIAKQYKQLYASRLLEWDRWKFLEKTEGSEMVYQSILPEEVLALD